MEAFLDRTDPDSSMVKPAHIHITRAPQIRKEKVLRTKPVCSAEAAAGDGASRIPATATIPAAAANPGVREPRAMADRC